MSLKYHLGVISDIHADCRALALALLCLETKSINEIVCCGDLVEKGTEGDSVIATFKEKKIAVVRGNHDMDVISNQKWLRKNTAFPDHPLLLQPDTLEFLQSLPGTLQAVIMGVKVLLAHGTPLNTWAYLHHHNPPERFLDVARSTDADVIILGHTHRPMHVAISGKYILNPGSVCGSEIVQGSRTCGVLTLPEIRWDVYDIDTRQPVQMDIRQL